MVSLVEQYSLNMIRKSTLMKTSKRYSIEQMLFAEEDMKENLLILQLLKLSTIIQDSYIVTEEEYNKFCTIKEILK